MAKKRDVRDVTLEVQLSDEELAELSQTQAARELELIAVETEQRDAARGFRARVKEIRKGIAGAAKEIQGGKGERTVKAEVRKTGTSIQFWSLDGKALYHERVMSPEEVQESLDLVDE